MDFEEISQELDLEFFFDRESIAYKMGRGHSGMQINAMECPTCGDNRYRVYLNADTGAGNCFVCNDKFSKLSFIKETTQLSWGDTAKFAKEILKDQGWRPKREKAAAVDMEQVKLPYSAALPTPDGQNLTYIRQRGISDIITKYFNLRYCQYGFWQFKDPETGESKIQHFDNRLIIPVFDIDGDLQTFQGRDLSGSSNRKYLFPSGLPGTGRYLLNAQNVQMTNEIVMGEGFFDVAAIKSAFDEDQSLRHIVPVGSFGKHLSYGSVTGDDQLGVLVRLKGAGIKRVTIMWDGEKKAITAALDAAKLISGLGMLCRIARLPHDKDPNEVLPEIVRKAFYEADTWSPKLDIRWRLKNPYA